MNSTDSQRPAWLDAFRAAEALLETDHAGALVAMQAAVDQARTAAEAILATKAQPGEPMTDDANDRDARTLTATALAIRTLVGHLGDAPEAPEICIDGFRYALAGLRRRKEEAAAEVLCELSMALLELPDNGFSAAVSRIRPAPVDRSDGDAIRDLVDADRWPSTFGSLLLRLLKRALAAGDLAAARTLRHAAAALSRPTEEKTQNRPDSAQFSAQYYRVELEKLAIEFDARYSISPANKKQGQFLRLERRAAGLLSAMYGDYGFAPHLLGASQSLIDGWVAVAWAWAAAGHGANHDLAVRHGLAAARVEAEARQDHEEAELLPNAESTFARTRRLLEEVLEICPPDDSDGEQEMDIERISQQILDATLELARTAAESETAAAGVHAIRRFLKLSQRRRRAILKALNSDLFLESMALGDESMALVNAARNVQNPDYVELWLELLLAMAGWNAEEGFTREAKDLADAGKDLAERQAETLREAPAWVALCRIAGAAGLALKVMQRDAKTEMREIESLLPQLPEGPTARRAAVAFWVLKAQHQMQEKAPDDENGPSACLQRAADHLAAWPENGEYGEERRAAERQIAYLRKSLPQSDAEPD